MKPFFRRAPKNHNYGLKKKTHPDSGNLIVAGEKKYLTLIKPPLMAKLADRKAAP